MALTQTQRSLILCTTNAQLHVQTFARRNGLLWMTTRNGRLTGRLRCLVVSKCSIHTITIPMTNYYFPKSIHIVWFGMADPRNYIILGISQCCQHIRISSDGLANWYNPLEMGDYDFYGTDPDGAVVYYNDQNHVFLTRDHNRLVWQVNQISL